MLGDIGSGKSRLVDFLCQETALLPLAASQSSSLASQTTKEIISFNYYTIDSDTVSSNSNLQVNLWTISNDHIYNKLHDIIKTSWNTGSIAYIIAIDLSKEEECILSLKKWLYIINSSTIASSNSNCNTAIIVVGCKADLLNMEGIARVQKAKEMQGKIRAICLHYKCALVYTSAASTDSSGCNLLKSYMARQVQLNDGSSFENSDDDDDDANTDGTNSCYIPTGIDTYELIAIATNYDVSTISEDQKIDLLQLLPTVTSSSSSSSGSKDNISTIESKEEWMDVLNNFIKQASGGSGGSNSNNNLQSLSSSSSSITSTSSTSISASTPIPLSGTVIDQQSKASSKTSRVSKRNSTAETDSKQDASDFFKNLLASSKK